MAADPESMRAAIPLLLLVCGNTPASASCPITSSEADKLLSHTVEAEQASSLGATLEYFAWRADPSNPDVIGRMVMGRGGSFHALLDNGLVGYFTVDLRTSDVRDVNGDAVNNPSLIKYRKRLLAERCASGR